MIYYYNNKSAEKRSEKGTVFESVFWKTCPTVPGIPHKNPIPYRSKMIYNSIKHTALRRKEQNMIQNEVLQCIKTRRSVRQYQPRQVEEDRLAAILEAGTYAASGMGKQSGRIVVVQDPADICELEKLNAAVMGATGHPFYGAPTVCVVLADPAVHTCVEDGSLIIGSLMLAAHSVGVDSCWIHRAREVFDSPEGKALLKKWGVEGDYIGVGHCILGYAAAEPGPAKPRKAGYVVRA